MLRTVQGCLKVTNISREIDIAEMLQSTIVLIVLKCGQRNENQILKFKNEKP
jgi:hypothetical protein